MFPDRLKALRKHRGLTQKELAEKVNVSQSTVGMWETDKREPTIALLIKLSQVFNVSTDFLLGHSLTQNTQEASLEESVEMSSLSENSKKDIREYINLVKLREAKERSIEMDDELSFGEPK